jgi:hypothetical protein
MDAEFTRPVVFLARGFKKILRKKLFFMKNQSNFRALTVLVNYFCISYLQTKNVLKIEIVAAAVVNNSGNNNKYKVLSLLTLFYLFFLSKTAYVSSKQDFFSEP